jgi:hypothetical protein
LAAGESPFWPGQIPQRSASAQLPAGPRSLPAESVPPPAELCRTPVEPHLPPAGPDSPLLPLGKVVAGLALEANAARALLGARGRSVGRVARPQALQVAHSLCSLVQVPDRESFFHQSALNGCKCNGKLCVRNGRERNLVLARRRIKRYTERRTIC